MSDGGHGANGHGTVEQRVTSLREEVDYLKTALPRIEEVQGEVISFRAEERAHHALTLDVRDRLHTLAGVQAHRFDAQGAQLEQLNAKMDSLMALLEAVKPKRRRK